MSKASDLFRKTCQAIGLARDVWDFLTLLLAIGLVAGLVEFMTVNSDWLNLGSLAQFLILCALFVAVVVTLSRTRQVLFETSEATSPDLDAVELFYDERDPRCRVLIPRSGRAHPAHDETVYRLGVRALPGYRLILERIDPINTRAEVVLATLPDSDDDDAGVVYVDVLQQVAPTSNATEPGRLRLASASDTAADWFERGEYALTFRLDGPTLRRTRIAVRYDERPHYRIWSVTNLEP